MLQALTVYAQKLLTEPITDENLNSLVGKIIQSNLDLLIKEVRANYSIWEEQLMYIESYLYIQLRELVEQVVTDIDNVSPIGRYQILLAIASVKPDDEIKKILKRYGKQLRTKVNPRDFQDRAKLIAKAMHRSALIYSMQWADRVIEESKIIAHKLDLNNKDVLRAHYQGILLVHDTLRMYLNQVEHAEIVSHEFEDKEVLAREMPSANIFNEIVEATVELFKTEGIFVPVVIKTLQDQENPYQLIIYAKDLLILYDLFQTYGPKLTEQKIRDRVAEEVRNDDLMDRFNNWLVYMAKLTVKREEFATPFAKKLKESLGRGIGTGKIIAALKARSAALTPNQKESVRYIVGQTMLEETTLIAGLAVGSWYLYLSGNFEKTGSDNLPDLINYLKKNGILVNELSDRDRIKLKEITEILIFIRSL